MLVSSVVPVSTQMVAPVSSLRCATPRFLRTMKVWPVKKFTAGSSSPSDVLREKLCSESRMSTSISPDLSTEKRSFEVRPMNFTLVGEPTTASAMARHKATSSPCHSPELS